MDHLLKEVLHSDNLQSLHLPCLQNLSLKALWFGSYALITLFDHHKASHEKIFLDETCLYSSSWKQVFDEVHHMKDANTLRNAGKKGLHFEVNSLGLSYQKEIDRPHTESDESMREQLESFLCAEIEWPYDLLKVLMKEGSPHAWLL